MAVQNIPVRQVIAPANGVLAPAPGITGGSPSDEASEEQSGGAPKKSGSERFTAPSVPGVTVVNHGQNGNQGA